GAGRHENETVGVELAYWQDCIDALARLQWQQVHYRFAARTAACLRYLVDLEPVHLAAARKAQQGVVSIGDEQLVDEVFVLDLRGRPAAAAAALSLVNVYRLGLRIAAVRKRYHDFLGQDQVLETQVGMVLDDFRAANISIGLP